MTQAELREILSSNIKFYRKRLLLTQEKLAERTGLSAQTINDIEGCRTWVSDKSLIRISEALGICPADLLLEQGSRSPADSGAASAEFRRIKNQLKATLLADIDSVFAGYAQGGAEL